MKKYLFISYLCLSSYIYGSSFSPNFSDMTPEEIKLAKDYHKATTLPHLRENPKKRWKAAIKLAKGGELDEVATELMWQVDRDGTWRDKIRIKIWYKIRKHVYLLLKPVGAILAILAAWLAIRWVKPNETSNQNRDSLEPQEKDQDNSTTSLTEENFLTGTDLINYNKAKQHELKTRESGLIYAAKNGHLNVVKHYVKNEKKNIKEIKDKDGNNALHMACLYSGDVKMVTWLLDVCKIDKETKGQYQKTPFLCAASGGKVEIANLLKERGADISAKTVNQSNALHWACDSSGSVEMVTWLLDVCKLDIETKGDGGTSSFLFAAAKGQLAIAKRLKERGANIHAKDQYENNALHLACLYSGSIEMVTWLLDVCKIGLETKGQYQNTPFLCAAKQGQLAIAKLLRQRGANLKEKDKFGNKALHLACYSGSVAVETWLLDVCKIGLETEGGKRMTPFAFAASTGELAIAKLLRQRGAHIHAKDKDGNNALHLACYYSRSVEMVTWLLDVCKIGLKTKGQYQRVPFLFAAQKGQLAITKLLKQRDADINAKDILRHNALHLACLFSDSVPMIKWLLDVCKIDIDKEARDQMTPFLFAAQKGHLKIAKLLKQRGANIHATDEKGNNALYFAEKYSKNKEMINYLKSLKLMKQA